MIQCASEEVIREIVTRGYLERKLSVHVWLVAAPHVTSLSELVVLPEAPTLAPLRSHCLLTVSLTNNSIVVIIALSFNGHYFAPRMDTKSAFGVKVTPDVASLSRRQIGDKRIQVVIVTRGYFAYKFTM